MNDSSKNINNPDDEVIARKLSQVAEQTHANGQFAARLEENLRSAYRPSKASWFTHISPVLRWVALMAILALVLSWSIKSLVPAPQPALNSTPSSTVATTSTPASDVPPAEDATPVTEEGGYDFRGATLSLQSILPDTPDQAHVYMLNKDQPATMEEARALADRFGIQGEMYTAPGLIYGTTDYVVSDGRQFLQVHSNRYFTYTADMEKNNTLSVGIPNSNAEAIIREFLTARGFDFNFMVVDGVPLGRYIVRQLAPDSIPMQYESFTQPVMQVALDENGEVLTVNASLMDYDPNPEGEYGIISAQEALQILLDDSILAGKTEFSRSLGIMPQMWYRNFPDDQTVAIHGYVTSLASTDPGKPALVLIGGTPAVGNTGGMESLDYYTFVEAKGRYFREGEIRKFDVESWNRDIESAYVTGSLRQDGDRIILVPDDGRGEQYLLLDPPANLPLGTDPAVSQLAFDGVIANGQMDWNSISYFADASQAGGGGGGGGMGFYQLNLTGTPVPFPTPTSLPGLNEGSGSYIVQEGDTLISIAESNGITVDELMQANGLSEPVVAVGQALTLPSPLLPDPGSLVGKRYENQSGLFIFNTYRKANGSERKEYAFVMANEVGSNYLILEGEGLEALERYHNLPVNLWATVESENEFGQLKVKVDKFEIPYPDLTFQIMKGRQDVQEINRERLLTFVADDGTTYIVRDIVGDIQGERFLFNAEGDEIIVEALVIPDETFAGYPTLRAFQVTAAVDPVSGQANEMTISANQPYVIEEETLPGEFTQPNLTITEVELVYFVSNPYYQVNDPNYERRSPYIQPAWHFHGYFDNGSEFDALIQALQQEYLLPELVPGVLPG